MSHKEVMMMLRSLDAHPRFIKDVVLPLYDNENVKLYLFTMPGFCCHEQQFSMDMLVRRVLYHLADPDLRNGTICIFERSRFGAELLCAHFKAFISHYYHRTAKKMADKTKTQFSVYRTPDDTRRIEFYARDTDPLLLPADLTANLVYLVEYDFTCKSKRAEPCCPLGA